MSKAAKKGKKGQKKDRSAEARTLVKRLLSLKDKSDAEARKIRRLLRKLGVKGGARSSKK